MSILVDLVVADDPRILRLLAVCDLSTKNEYGTSKPKDQINPNEIHTCNVPHKHVLASKIRDLLNEV